jgi:uncharacterized tellurite resistance protein B-like protein
MLKTLKDLFDNALDPGMNLPSDRGEHSLQLATAVLLIEVMRADTELHEDERDAVIAALREKFGLAEDEVARLMELAHETSEDAYDYHRFTSEINRRCDMSRRVRIIEYMWQVAWADGHLSAHENHLMRKVASLLYLSHADYVGAKARARTAAGAD